MSIPGTKNENKKNVLGVYLNMKALGSIPSTARERRRKIKGDNIEYFTLCVAALLMCLLSAL